MSSCLGSEWKRRWPLLPPLSLSSNHLADLTNFAVFNILLIFFFSSFPLPFSFPLTLFPLHLLHFSVTGSSLWPGLVWKLLCSPGWAHCHTLTPPRFTGCTRHQFLCFTPSVHPDIRCVLLLPRLKSLIDNLSKPLKNSLWLRIQIQCFCPSVLL